MYLEIANEKHALAVIITLFKKLMSSDNAVDELLQLM